MVDARIQRALADARAANPDLTEVEQERIIAECKRRYGWLADPDAFAEFVAYQEEISEMVRQMNEDFVKGWKREDDDWV